MKLGTISQAHPRAGLGVMIVMFLTSSLALAEVRIEGTGARSAPAAPGGTAPAKTTVATKKDGLGSQLLLPIYKVEAANPNGATTLYAVRNESSDPVSVEIRYYEDDRPQTPQRIETVTLNGKQVKTVNLRDVPNLEVANDGFARGYVVIESLSAVASLDGDYFQVTTSEGFAQGDRLVNADAASADGDLCQRMTTRYLNGAPFSGSVFNFWLASDTPPSLDDPVLFYTVYSEDGSPAFSASVRSDRVAFSVPAAELLQLGPLVGPPYGVIEFEFNQTIGYVSVTMSAAGLYSVGIEAVCMDGSGF